MGRLVVMARYPAAGATKTRLIPALGAEGAAELSRVMTEYTLRQAMRCNAEVEVRYTGGDEARMRALFGARRYVDQGGGDLGERMGRAVMDALATEVARPVLIVGTDCPGVTAAVMGEAFEALRSCDVVLGPAADGGYYLIGMTRAHPALFDGVAWGTEAVLGQTLRRAARLGLCVRLLETRRDVDVPTDLPVTMAKDRISVVIPALNEAAGIGETVRRAAGADEVIVVDGGSHDGTVEAARDAGARVIRGPRGRGRQMNAGFGAAGGDIVVFVHADTWLPAGWDGMVRDAMEGPAVAGAFELGASRGTPGWVARMVAWRSRRQRMPYGDQALFMRAAMFRELGGFSEAEVMEDYALVRRLRRLGPIAVVEAAVESSGRFWARHGAWGGTWINQVVIAGWHLGVSPGVLSRFRGRRKKPGD